MRTPFHILARKPIFPSRVVPTKALFCPYGRDQRASMVSQDTAMPCITCRAHTSACRTYGKAVVHDSTIGVDVVGEGD
jgi:hypothetical protein